jgi:hypothetical protein
VSALLFRPRSKGDEANRHHREEVRRLEADLARRRTRRKIAIRRASSSPCRERGPSVSPLAGPGHASSPAAAQEIQPSKVDRPAHNSEADQPAARARCRRKSVERAPPDGRSFVSVVGSLLSRKRKSRPLTSKTTLGLTQRRLSIGRKSERKSALGTIVAQKRVGDKSCGSERPTLTPTGQRAHGRGCIPRWPCANHT